MTPMQKNFIEGVLFDGLSQKDAATRAGYSHGVPSPDAREALEQAQLYLEMRDEYDLLDIAEVDLRKVKGELEKLDEKLELFRTKRSELRLARRTKRRMLDIIKWLGCRLAEG